MRAEIGLSVGTLVVVVAGTFLVFVAVLPETNDGDEGMHAHINSATSNHPAGNAIRNFNIQFTL